MDPFRRICWMIALACMWSPSFLFIKLATSELPPMTIAACRVTIAALLLLSVLFFTKRALPTSRSFWLHSGVMAIFSSTLPFSLFCFAEQSIESAMAAILNGSSPMFTALLAQLFLPSDRLSGQKGLGILFSVVGLVVLFSPSLQTGAEVSYVGMLAALSAALCYAISHIYGKKFMTKQAPLVAPTAQLIFSACILWPLVLAFETPLPSTLPSLEAMGGIFGLGFFGTFIAFMIYYKLLEESGPTAISAVACVFPVVGMFLGFLFLGESLTSMGLCAAALIFTGLLLVNEWFAFGKKVPSKA